MKLLRVRIFMMNKGFCGLFFGIMLSLFPRSIAAMQLPEPTDAALEQTMSEKEVGDTIKHLAEVSKNFSENPWMLDETTINRLMTEIVQLSDKKKYKLTSPQKKNLYQARELLLIAWESKSPLRILHESKQSLENGLATNGLGKKDRKLLRLKVGIVNKAIKVKNKNFKQFLNGLVAEKDKETRELLLLEKITGADHFEDFSNFIKGELATLKKNDERIAIYQELQELAVVKQAEAYAAATEKKNESRQNFARRQDAQRKAEQEDQQLEKEQGDNDATHEKKNEESVEDQSVRNRQADKKKQDEERKEAEEQKKQEELRRKKSGVVAGFLWSNRTFAERVALVGLPIAVISTIIIAAVAYKNDIALFFSSPALKDRALLEEWVAKIRQAVIDEEYTLKPQLMTDYFKKIEPKFKTLNPEEKQRLATLCREFDEAHTKEDKEALGARCSEAIREIGKNAISNKK